MPDWAKQPERPTYTPEEIGAQPEGDYLQDGDVPAWAMQPQKPTYTAQEVGAQPTGDYATRSEIPEKLPNPNSLTIKGQTYDGSQPVNVEVADGKTPVKGVDYFTEAEIQDVAEQAAELVPGGGSELELIFDYTVEGEAVALVEVSEDMSKKPFRFRKIFVFVDVATASDLGTGTGPIWLYVGSADNNRRIIFNTAGAYTMKRAYGGYFFGMDGFCAGRFAATDLNQSELDDVNGIPFVKLQCPKPDTFQFQPGTVFKIYGEGRIE